MLQHEHDKNRRPGFDSRPVGASDIGLGVKGYLLLQCACIKFKVRERSKEKFFDNIMTGNKDYDHSTSSR